MEDNRFDGLVRRLSGDGLRRRDAVVATAAGALGFAIGRPATDEAAAKNKKKRCVKGNKVCTPDGKRCCSKECCPPLAGGGDSLCRPKKNAACCTEAEGGGFCDHGFTKCCPPILDDQVGTCAGPDYTCCTEVEGGGACPPEEPTCCPPDPAHPYGTCCSGAGCCTPPTSQARARTPRERGRRRQ